ncbi:hypothetical protein BCR36DRAFT_314613, partial [Piromyces finnis]
MFSKIFSHYHLILSQSVNKDYLDYKFHEYCKENNLNDEFLTGENDTIYKLILLLFENSNKQLLFWNLKQYSGTIIQWLWMEIPLKYLSPKNCKKPLNDAAIETSTTNSSSEMNQPTLFLKLRVQITMKWLTIYYDETSEPYFTKAVCYLINRNIHNKLLDYVDYSSGTNNPLIMTLILIITWNKQKDLGYLYEPWRPYLKYIWLIIYKYIIDKMESNQLKSFTKNLTSEIDLNQGLDHLFKINLILININMILTLHLPLEKKYSYENLLRYLYELFIHSGLSQSILKDNDIKMTMQHSNTSDHLFSPSLSDINNNDEENGEKKMYGSSSTLFFPECHENLSLDTKNEPEEYFIGHNYNIIYSLLTCPKDYQDQNKKSDVFTPSFLDSLKLQKNLNKSDLSYFIPFTQQLCSCFCSSTTFFSTLLSILREMIENHLSNKPPILESSNTSTIENMQNKNEFNKKNEYENENNQKDQKNNLFLVSAMVPQSPISSILPKAPSSSVQFPIPHYLSFNGSQNEFYKYSSKAPSPVDFLEELIHQEIQPILELLSLKDTILHLFPTNIFHKNKSNSRQYNSLYSIFCYSKDNIYLIIYKVSSQFYFLSGLLKSHLLVNEATKKIKLEQEKQKKEIKAFISTPSSSTEINFSTSKNPIFSFPMLTSNLSLSNNPSE